MEQIDASRGRDEALAMDHWQLWLGGLGTLGAGGLIAKAVDRALKQRDDAPKVAADQTRAQTERAQLEAELEIMLRKELRDENATLRTRAVETEETAAKRVRAAEDRYGELKNEMTMLSQSVEGLIAEAQRAARERDAHARRIETIEQERAKLIALNDGLRAQNLELKNANDALRGHNVTLIKANGELAMRTKHLEEDLEALQRKVASTRKPSSAG